MATDLSTVFTGVRFDHPFLLSSAPPTESESNILRAFDAGWGGVVTKTIGLHPVVNVAGPKTKFMRADADSPRLSMKIEGGVPGDIATAAIVVNSIPKVVAAAPGLHTMLDLPLPSFFPGA